MRARGTQTVGLLLILVGRSAQPARSRRACDGRDAAISEQPAKGERPRDFATPINTTVKLARVSDRQCVLMLDHLQAPLLTNRHPIDPTIRWLVAEPMNLLPDDPTPDLRQPGNAVASRTAG
jgi:hypothetical protein